MIFASILNFQPIICVHALTAWVLKFLSYLIYAFTQATIVRHYLSKATLTQQLTLTPFQASNKAR
jgi:hypothetical protein